MIQIKNYLQIDRPKKKSELVVNLFDDNKDKSRRLSQDSPYAHLKSYKIRSLIVKSGDDLRQEQMVMQIISIFKSTF